MTSEVATVARNVSTRYLAIAIEMAVGLLVLPFNIAHLGQSAYGLWVLTASITAYFSVLDLGYSGALVKFVAQYRARRDVAALNEILSTTFYLFAIFSAVTYLVAVGLAMNLGQFLHVTPEQEATGRIVLLIISMTVALGTAFSVFGAVINGFQRYDLNNVVGAGCSVLVAGTNVAVLMMGYGLVGLVAATTAVRVVTLFVYRANAYRVFPQLRLSPSLFTRARLREVTQFSVFMLLIDWANKLNFSVDAIVIGAFLDTTAVAVWAVGQRLADATQRLTNQLNDVLFPNVVDHDSAARGDRLQTIFLVATRLSLATVVPLGTALALMAGPLVMAWVGPAFSRSVLIVQLLAAAVIVRVGVATAGTVLKGAGRHRLLAWNNVLTAIANLLLSVALVRPLGIAGVAIGTLIPVTISSFLFVFPAGCRRVGIGVARAFTDAVWPAVWPAALMAAFVAATRSFVRPSLPAVAAELVLSIAIYAAAFLAFGVTASERRLCVAKAQTWLSRERAMPPPVSEVA